MYRDNQFEKSSVYSGESSFDLVNPQFVYPKRAVRIATGVDGNGFPLGPDAIKTVSVPLKAGFMRNLWTGYGTSQDQPKSKLQFQFNPQDIQQEVVARQDMYLSVLQDPAQLSQPVAGNANFRFDLLFDRTMEVKNGGNKKATLDDPPGVRPGTQGPGDASDIGVLADLQVMYAIIGQGMSAGTMSEQSARLKLIAKREYERAVSAQDPYFNENSAVNQDSVKLDQPYAKKDFETLYQASFVDSNFVQNINMGNAAFLVPMPVRILFSSLYMVDGYVVKSSVMFTKFSTNMVPIQCRVLLEVNAVYLGFARDRTFVTDAIENSINQERATKAASKEEAQNFIKNLAALYLKNLNVAFTSITASANPAAAGKASFSNSSGSAISGGEGGINDTFFTNPKAVGFGAKGDWWYGTTVDGDRPAYCAAFQTPEDPTNEKVRTFFVEDGTVTIGLSLKINVYGPSDSEAAAKTGVAPSIGYYSLNEWINSADDWNYGVFRSPLTWTNTINVSNGAITREKGFDLGIGPDPNEEVTRAINGLYDAWGSKWFKFVVRATVKITGSQDSTQTGNTYLASGEKTAEQTFYAQGSTDLGNKVVSLTFNWSNSFVGTPTTTPTNYTPSP